MDDRKRTLAAVTVIIGCIVFVAIIIGVLISGKKVLSPVPDEDAIKIIFVSPSPVAVASPTPTELPTPSSKVKQTATSTPKVTATPKQTITPTPTEKP